MITIQELVQAGYNEFTVHSSHLKNADRAVQKCVWLGPHKKYYITVWYYDHRSKEYWRQGMPEYGISFDMQFYGNKEQTWFFDMTISPGDQTLQQIEAFIEKLWTQMSQVFYERDDYAEPTQT